MCIRKPPRHEEITCPWHSSLHFTETERSENLLNLKITGLSKYYLWHPGHESAALSSSPQVTHTPPLPPKINTLVASLPKALGKQNKTQTNSSHKMGRCWRKKKKKPKNTAVTFEKQHKHLQARTSCLVMNPNFPFHGRISRWSKLSHIMWPVTHWCKLLITPET